MSAPSVYFSSDNGGYPFCVTALESVIKITKDPNWSNTRNPIEYTDLVAEFSIATVLPGIAQTEEWNNNTILISLQQDNINNDIHRYVYVGEMVYEFSTTETIQSYYTFMGNSEVPYPVAVSQNMAYFMLDKAVVPKSAFPPDTDWLRAYSDYYDLPQEQSQPMQQVINLHNHPDADLPVRPAVPSEPAQPSE